MIVGAGLDRTGIMNRVAAEILKRGGSTENAGPADRVGDGGRHLKLSAECRRGGAVPAGGQPDLRTPPGIPLSRLLMPMGFCAILGGTMTMVGSSPLILLNDLILTANQGLPDEMKMEPFHLFSVTPIGAGADCHRDRLFPGPGPVGPAGLVRPDRCRIRSTGRRNIWRRVYGLHAQVFEVDVPADSPLVGQILADINNENNIYIISTFYRGKASMIQILTAEIAAPCRLAIIGSDGAVQRFAEKYGLRIRPDLDVFVEEFAPTNAGVAELVIPPDSKLIGKSPRDLLLRKTYGLSLMAIHRGEDTLSHVKTEDHEPTQIGTVPFRPGDMLVAHHALGQPVAAETGPGLHRRDGGFPARRAETAQGQLGASVLRDLAVADPVHRYPPVPLPSDRRRGDAADPGAEH